MPKKRKSVAPASRPEAITASSPTEERRDRADQLLSEIDAICDAIAELKAPSVDDGPENDFFDEIEHLKLAVGAADYEIMKWYAQGRPEHKR